MKKWQSSLRWILVALLAAVHANAWSAPAVEHPCSADAKKFCPDVKPGGGRIHHCLKGREKELSEACQSARQEYKERAEKFHQACGADAKGLCKDVKPGAGRILSCLKSNEANLSAACRQEFAHAKTKDALDHTEK